MHRSRLLGACRPFARPVLVVVLLAAAGGAGRPALAGDDPKPTMAQVLERLRAMDEVNGSAVGEGGDEGEFFKLWKSIAAGGDEALDLRLLDEASPVARAMGVYDLAQRKGKDAVATLRGRLADRARFVCFPGGCCGETVSLGSFARSVLRNKNYLRFATDAAPLVDADTAIGLDLAILADERCTNLHGELKLELDQASTAGTFRPTWADVRRLGAGLSDVALVKAIGRWASPHGTDLLVARLDDATAEREVRLAAASGLTRIASEAARAVLVRAKPWLDGLPGGALGKRFVAEAEARKTQDERWKAIHAIKTWVEMEKIAGQVKTAVTCDHPMALSELPGMFGMAITGDDKGVRQALVDSLLRIAKGVGDHVDAWDTYADAPYLLEPLVVPAWGSERDHDPDYLTAAEKIAILAAIRPFLAAR